MNVLSRLIGYSAVILIAGNVSAASQEQGEWPVYEPTEAPAPQTYQPAAYQPYQAEQRTQGFGAQQRQPANQQSKDQNRIAYLGMGVDFLPESVLAQLPEGIAKGEGILITRFADDSPVKNTGIKAYDILLAYDDTKLVHPRQYIELIRNDMPDRAVKLKVLRNSEITTHTVVLGSQTKPQQRDGLAIKKIGNDIYEATIRFTAADGSKQVRSYKGNQEQIYYQALNAQDLPPRDKQQILFATKPQNKDRRKGFGSMFPWGGNNNGNDGWGKFFPWGGNNNNSWSSFFPFN